MDKIEMIPNKFLEAALKWFVFGLQVIPVIPNTKKPAVKWDQWLDNLDEKRINDYWNEHPDHELAFIVGPKIAVFDMDSDEATKAMLSIMKRYATYPLIVVETEQGCHYYFQIDDDIVIQMDSHSTAEHPERIDVKTGRSAIMLPPSNGKQLELYKAENASELTTASQDFIDDVFRHNGRQAPSEAKSLPTTKSIKVGNSSSLPKLKILLDQVNSDLGYQDWLNVIMAVYHETAGSDEGFELIDTWSSGGKKYKGQMDVETKWRSLSSGNENPITIATLYSLAMDNVEAFERCKTVIVYPEAERLLADVVNDSAAPLEQDSIDVLALIQKSHPAEYQRKRAQLKQANSKVSLAAIDRMVKASASDEGLPNTHHGYAKDLIQKLTHETWPPVSHNGALHVVEKTTGLWVSRSIDKLQSTVAETHDGQENCKRTNDYKAIAGHAISLTDGTGYFDEAPSGIACPGGFYYIEAGEIKVEPLSPDHRQRFRIEVDPTELPTPLFDKFLHETFTSPTNGEEDQQRQLLQELAGAIMLGIMPKIQKATLFYDPYGRAGKGTVERILRELVPGKYVTAVSPFSWDSEYHVASLAASRLNVVGELPDDKPIPAAIFKSVLGGDLITGRHPTHRPITFKNEAAHLFMSNHFINTRDYSEAFFARWLLLEFPNSLLRSGKRTDTGLADRIIKAELPGIAFWALEGARRLLVAGEFSKSIVNGRLMTDWRRSRNSLDQFVHEGCRLEPELKVKRSDFYNAYKEWCLEVGKKPFAKSKVKDLLEHGIGYGITHSRPNGIETFNGVDVNEEEFEPLFG